MEIRITLLLCSGVMYLLMAGLLAFPISATKEQRINGKPAERRVDHNALDYMRKLHSSMTDEDGAPIDVEVSPTSVWCLLNNRGKLSRTPAASAHAQHGHIKQCK